MQKHLPNKLLSDKDEVPLPKGFRIRWVFLYWIIASLIVALTYEGSAFSVENVAWLFLGSLLILIISFFIVSIIPLLIRFFSKNACSEGTSLFIAFWILPLRLLTLILFFYFHLNSLQGDSNWEDALWNGILGLTANFNNMDNLGAVIQKVLWWISFILESIFYFFFLLSPTRSIRETQLEVPKDTILNWTNMWTVLLTGFIVISITALTYSGKFIELFIQWNLINFCFHIVGIMILPCLIRLFHKNNFSPRISILIIGICPFILYFFLYFSLCFSRHYESVLWYLELATIPYTVLRTTLIWTFYVALLLLAYKVLRSPIGLAALFCGIKSKVSCRPASLSLIKKIWRNFLW